MLKRFSEWLYQISSGWITITGLVIFLLFSSLVLPRQSAASDSQTDEAGSPDLSLFYSAGDLYQMAESYGEAGRVEYVRVRYTFDVIWPLVYTLFLSTSISWLYGRFMPPSNAWRVVNLAPILAMLLDFLENISTSIVMYRYPQPTSLIAVLAPFFTLYKWLLVAASFVFLVAGIFIALWKRFQNQASGG